MRFSKKDIKRFLSHVKKTRSCWIWTASKTRKGYANFRVKRKLFRAHRFSYMIHVGRIPKGKLICHKCDFPECTNPRHLWIGTPNQNSKDMVKKKRQSMGEKVYCAILNKSKIKTIRKRYKKGNITQAKLAKKYKITESCISEIVNKLSWKSVK